MSTLLTQTRAKVTKTANSQAVPQPKNGIASSRQKENLQNRAIRLNQIITTQSRLAEANFNLKRFMNLVVKQMQKITPATGVVIELVEGQEMVYCAATGTIKNYLGLRLPMKHSISGLCVRTRKVLSCDDTETDPRVNLVACRKIGARSLVVAPLFHEGRTAGVLKITSTKPHGFNDLDVQTLQLMAGLIGSALAHQVYYQKLQNALTERTHALSELKKAQKILQHLAQHDYLTDLPNRSLFKDKLLKIKNGKKAKYSVAVMYLDIDHFKTINDNQGHAIGDELLKKLAARLKNCIRFNDTVARLGGDEFVILLNKIKNKKEGTNIAKKILQKMQEPFNIQNKLLTTSISIGIAFSSIEKFNEQSLIKQADTALYRAKHAGRNTYKIFDK